MTDDSPEQVVPDPFEGTSLRAIRRLGGGSMGEVFVVEHRELGRRFAAKILHARLATEPHVVDRMRLEGQTLARLTHPNVVAIQGFDTTPAGRPYLVIELLAGQTLAEALTRGALPVNLAIHYGEELLSGLAAAHEIGVVHRDVKPDNIFLAESRHRRAPELKLIDFGIARVLPDAPAAAPEPLVIPTTTGAVLGTPHFSSPEGALGLRVDERADLYGAALVIYAMLTGRGPFDHIESEAAVLGAHVNEVPAPPSAHAPEPVPAELDALLLKALDKEPTARFASAREFKAELAQVGALLARPAGWLETTAYQRGERASGVADLASPPRLARPEPVPRLSRRAVGTIVLFAALALIASIVIVVSVGLRLRGAP
jgi:serine/threonine-protein kinase